MIITSNSEGFYIEIGKSEAGNINLFYGFCKGEYRGIITQRSALKFADKLEKAAKKIRDNVGLITQK